MRERTECRRSLQEHVLPEPSPIFNNREIASGIWLLIVLGFCFGRSEVRSSLVSIVKAFLEKKILLITVSFAVNASVICWLLKKWNIWQANQLPATVLWTVFSMFPLISGAFNAQERDGHFRQLFFNSLKITAAFEFVVVAHPFSLPVELILVPFTTCLAMMLVISESDEKHAAVHKLIQWVLVAIVVVIAWYSIKTIWDDPAKFLTGRTARNFVLPIFLTIGSIPFLYLWYCYSHIEQARIGIDQKTFQSDDLKRYARRRFFLIFPLRPWLLRRAVNRFQSMPAESRADVNRIVDEIYQYERDADDPPAVDPAQGWSPYLAREFLANEGLQAIGTRSNFNEEWWASSSTVDLDKAVIPNTITLYLEGEEGVAKSLKLKGYFFDEFRTEEGIEKFANIAAKLAEVAIGADISDEMLNNIFAEVRALEQGHKVVAATGVSWEVERFANDKGFFLIFQLTR